MATIIQMAERQVERPRRTLSNPEGASILFFTGVRYERTSPVQKAEKRARKRPRRKAAP